MKKIFQMKEPSQKEAGAQDGKALHIRKNDWLLIVVLLVAAAGIYVAIQYYQKVSTQNAVAVVTVDGVEYGRYPLSEDHTETIRFEDGSYNRFAIQDGYVSMPEASCPDQICVHQQEQGDDRLSAGQGSHHDRERRRLRNRCSATLEKRKEQ